MVNSELIPSLEERISTTLTSGVIREGIVTIGKIDKNECYSSAYVVRDYFKFMTDLKLGKIKDNLLESLKINNLPGWHRDSKEDYFYDIALSDKTAPIFDNLLTPNGKRIYQLMLDANLGRLPAPEYENYETEGYIESSQIQFRNSHLNRIGLTEKGDGIFGSPLNFVICSKRAGCYDTGWWNVILHGLTTDKELIIYSSV